VEVVVNRAYGYKQNPQGDYVNAMINLFWVGDDVQRRKSGY